MSGIYWLAYDPKSGNIWFRAFLQNLLIDGEKSGPNAGDFSRFTSLRGHWLSKTSFLVTGSATRPFKGVGQRQEKRTHKINISRWLGCSKP